MRVIITCVMTMCAVMVCHGISYAQQITPGSFEQVEVTELKPEDLGTDVGLENPASLLNPAVEDAVLELSETERLALRDRVAPSVVEIVALHMPPQPYEQIPMIYRGHAVWLSAKSDGSDPVLISTLAWLEDAKEIYLVPDDEKAKKKSKRKIPRRDVLSAGERTLEQVSSGEGAWRAFKKKKKDYIRVTPKREDSMRGLVWLTTEAKGTPSKGMSIIPEKTTSLNYLFGYTYLFPERLTDVRLMPTRSGTEELSYFFLNTYNGTLGAPVFNERGQIVMLNALRNPQDASNTLAIPPGALREFVGEAQGAR